MWTKPKKGQTIDPWLLPSSLPLFPKMMHSPSMTSNVPVTKTLLNVQRFFFKAHGFRGVRPPCRGRGEGSSSSFSGHCAAMSFFLINGAWEGSGMAVWHVPCTDALCVHVCMFVGSVCVRVLCIQTPSVWWPDTVWESVCRRRIHTQHKGPIMSPHSEKEKGWWWTRG